MLSEMLSRSLSGYRGEVWVDSIWHQMTIPSDYYLLHQYKIVDEKGFSYQMDTVFLCSYFVLIVEIKNINGRIDYDDETHQCIRTNLETGKVEGFTNAANQVRRHAKYLANLLHKLDVIIPVEYVVVFSNPKTIIGSRVSYCPMIHVSGIPDFVNKLYGKYHYIHLDYVSLHRLAMCLSQLHVEEIPNIKIERAQLKRGMLCESCGYQCVYESRKWRCIHCGSMDRSAFIKALAEYRLLFGETINNTEFRDFFGIEKDYVAYEFLKNLNYKTVGKNRYKKYIIPLDIVDLLREG